VFILLIRSIDIKEILLKTKKRVEDLKVRVNKKRKEMEAKKSLDIDEEENIIISIAKKVRKVFVLSSLLAAI